MPNYRLNYVNSDNYIVSHIEHAYTDDLSALEKAWTICKDYTIEIWQDKRRVARVKKGNAALDVSDLQSL